jgi:DNA-binding protein HU-beta
LNESEFVGKVAAESGVSVSEAEGVMTALFETLIGATNSGEKIAWPGFGTFQVKTRPEREGRNPSTGATIHISATNVMHIGAAAGLKAKLSPYEQRH